MPIDEWLATGQRVDARSDRWVVQSVAVHGDCRSAVLDGCGYENRGITRTLLLPFDRLTPARAGAARMGAVGRRAWSHALARTLLDAHPFGGLISLERTAIELLPFQLEPALAMLRHARTRILIADEVGLGKTIQAGILLRELASRDKGFRGLILTPAGVRDQWQRELHEKFLLETTFADTAWLTIRTRDLPADVNPWALPGIYVASLDLVKRPEVLRALEDVTWDLTVVDEVHNAGPGTARLAAVEAIAARSRRVVLLTATPPDGDPSHLSAILDLGRLRGAPLTEFRRTRADTAIECEPRKTLLLPVRISALEQRLHRLLETYTSLVWTEAGARSDGRARLAAVVLRKRALSSAASLAISVRRRLALLTSPPAPGAEQLLLPWDEDQLGDDAPDDLLGARGLDDDARERALLEEIAGAADEAARVESKLAFLLRFVRRVREPVVIFTEYRDTLAQIASTLGGDRHLLLLHGEMLSRERTAVRRAFNREGGILLATDAASEGLNLHHTCRLVVHFELPWTPMRLEQRTGRVDRFGQTRRVHEVLLVAQDTAERLVFAPLLNRARAAASRHGWSLRALDESTVAAALMDGIDVVPAHLDQPPSSERLDLADEARAEADRVLLHRRLRVRVGAAVRNGARIPVHLEAAGCSQVLVIVAVELVSRTGQVLHSELVPILVAARVDVASLSAREVNRWADEFVARCHAAILTRAREHAAPVVDRAVAGILASTDSASARERAMVTAIAPTAQQLVQAGLFDRRALNEARKRHTTAALLTGEAAARLEGDPAREIETRARILAIRGWCGRMPRPTR
jgi:superfamily II DNA or RNA helicase